MKSPSTSYATYASDVNNKRSPTRCLSDKRGLTRSRLTRCLSQTHVNNKRSSTICLSCQRALLPPLMFPLELSWVARFHLQHRRV